MPAIRPAALVCALTLPALVAPAFAVDYDEAISGDLSDDQFAPTDLGLLDEGSNLVDGSTTFDPLDRDFFTFEVPAGLELSAIILAQYDSEQDFSFLAIEDDAVFDTLISSDNFLGTAVVGNASLDSGEGDDLLDNLADPFIFGGLGFSGNLGPGVYTLWFQETAGPVDYAFDLVLVPAPSVAALLGVAGLGAMRRRRA